MESSSPTQLKRSHRACARCRKQKIKCSGQHPCLSCTQRRVSCVFDERDQKVLVTQGYLEGLRDKIARLEKRLNTQPPRPQQETPREHAVVVADQAFPENQTEDASRNTSCAASSSTALDMNNDDDSSFTASPAGTTAPELTNPLTARPSQYISTASGTPFYLGTSSNWSFSRRVLKLAHEHVYHERLPTDRLLFDGFAYDLDWDGAAATRPLDGRSIPSMDYAIFLLNGVKFHCCQLFHLFEEDEIMASLHRIYADPPTRPRPGDLSYIHVLLLLAFGKGLVRQKRQGTKPTGVELFVKALQLLPNVTALCRQPVVASEILCCVACYFQALDFRHAAHTYIVQAKSIAMNFGMHTDMPASELGESLVQRCHKIWWTVYVLDRQMTSLMGLPQSIRDEGFHCQLPIHVGSFQRTAAMRLQIRLARVVAEISMTVYGSDGTLGREPMGSIKAVLENIAPVADDLRDVFPLPPDEHYSGISRLTAHLHLLYYQCIVLATRPLLFACFAKRLEVPAYAAHLVSLPHIENPLAICVESSHQILHVLESLQAQDSLETFLPFDLDALSVSTPVLLMARVTAPRLLGNRTSWMSKSHGLFEEMVNSGNMVAKSKHIEVQQLDKILCDFLAKERPSSTHSSIVAHTSEYVERGLKPYPGTDNACPPPLLADGDLDQATTTTTIAQVAATAIQRSGSVDTPESGLIQPGFLSAEQIIAVAGSMELTDIDWISFTASLEQS